MVDARAEVPKFAFLAVGIACLAAAAAMPDQPVGEECPLIPVAELHEILLDLHGIIICCEAESQGEAADMSVDNDPFVDAESVSQDDIGGLAARSGNGGKFLHGGGNFSIVAFHKCSSHATKRLRLVTVEACGADDLLKIFLRDLGVVRGALAAFEEHLGHHIDPDVGALGREDRGDEKFQRVLEIKFAVGIGIDPRELTEEFLGALFSCHGRVLGMIEKSLIADPPHSERVDGETE